jgi:hypothetical protein
MGRAGILVTLAAPLGARPDQAPTCGRPEKATSPVLGRTFSLEGVRGPADRTGIPGWIDHVAYDPATGQLFIACVANGTLEVLDLTLRIALGDSSRYHESSGNRKPV